MQNKIFRSLVLVLSVILFSLFSLSARAGNTALLDVIGYSSDGQYFAFEEYGVQDGSGFAFSSIYIVDLSDDSWVIGTPIKVIEEYDEATYEVEPIDYGKNIQKVRSLAYEQAKFRLEGLNITTPAWGIAFNGDGKPNDEGLSDESLSLEYFLPSSFGGILSETLKISLETYNTQSGLPCMEWFEKEPVGFLLTISNEAGEVKEVYRDKAIPRSRGCAFSYKIYGVYVPFEATNLSKSVAIISVYAGGYEGPDRRFVAVPVGAFGE